VNDKQRLLQWFYRQDALPGVQSFEALLRLAAERALGMATADAAGYAQRASARAWSDLLTATDVDLLYGRTPIIAVVDRDQRQFQWEAQRLLAGTLKERTRGYRLLAKSAILRRIDSLSNREYEALGCVVCSLIGATHVRLTGSSGEGGVDFFAFVPMPGPCHVFGGSGYAIRIVGQSKKYGSKLTVDRVRDFCETLNDIRYTSTVVEPLVPAWFRAAKGPIVGWMVAHSGAQSGSLTRANNHGVVLSDSVDFAEIASIARRLDTLQSPADRAALLVTKTSMIASAAGSSTFEILAGEAAA
jgi:hypothetical protein